MWVAGTRGLKPSACLPGCTLAGAATQPQAFQFGMWVCGSDSLTAAPNVPTIFAIFPKTNLQFSSVLQRGPQVNNIFIGAYE